MQTLMRVATLILNGITRGVAIAYAVVPGIVKERIDYFTASQG